MDIGFDKFNDAVSPFLLYRKKMPIALDVSY